MKSTKGLLWRVSGAVVVGIVLLLAIGVGAIRMLTEVDPWPVFEAMDLGWLLAAVLGFVFGNILVGHRFLAMLSEDTPAHREPWRVGSLFFGASVFSLVLPGPVGELAACAALKKRYGIVFSRGLATAVHARLVGLASAALMAIAVLPFVEVSSNLGEVLRVGAAMVCVAGLGVGVLTAMPSWMQWVSTTVERSPLARVLGSAMILIRALSETGRAPLRTWLKVLAWSVVIQGVQLLTIAMVGMALGLVPTLPGLLLAQGTGSLGILVGVILPGGLGTYEVAVISSFAGPGGLALASAGVLAVGIRIVHLLGLGSAGIMFAFWAKVLTAGEVMADVEQAQGGT